MIGKFQQRLQAEEATLPEDLSRPVGVPDSFDEHARLMFDLQALAFQADLTRVITFMWGSEQHEGDYREIGVADGHHASSHHAGQAYMIENFSNDSSSSNKDKLIFFDSRKLSFFRYC